MAKAKIEEKEIFVKSTEKVVNLELTMKEAQTLFVLLRNIGGEPKKSARKYSNSVLEALEEIGLKSNYCLGKLLQIQYSSFYFKYGSDKLI